MILVWCSRVWCCTGLLYSLYVYLLCVVVYDSAAGDPCMVFASVVLYWIIVFSVRVFAVCGRL